MDSGLLVQVIGMTASWIISAGVFLVVITRHMERRNSAAELRYAELSALITQVVRDVNDTNVKLVDHMKAEIDERHEDREEVKRLSREVRDGFTEAARERKDTLQLLNDLRTTVASVDERTKIWGERRRQTEQIE